MFNVYTGAVVIVLSIVKQRGKTSGEKECLHLAFEYV